MTSATMELVMTHSGLQIESRIPDEEIPESIVFQGIEYVRVRCTTFSWRSDTVAGERYRHLACDECGKNVGHKEPSYCPKCGRKGVGSDD